MAGRVRLSVVGAAGTLPSKCSKCTVDAVVLVEPRHAALARAAINKLRLKVKDVERVKLVLKSAVREHAVGTELPCGEADLSSYLATDCVVAVSVMEAHTPSLRGILDQRRLEDEILVAWNGEDVFHCDQVQ